LTFVDLLSTEARFNAFIIFFLLLLHGDNVAAGFAIRVAAKPEYQIRSVVRELFCSSFQWLHTQTIVVPDLMSRLGLFYPI